MNRLKLSSTLSAYFISILFLSSFANAFAQKDSTHFVFTIKTDEAGLSNDSSFAIHTYVNAIYNFDVDWNNDGVFDTLAIKGNIKHQYDGAGTYTIRIRGSFPDIEFGRTNVGVIMDADKLMAIEQWGTNKWLDLSNAFFKCTNMEYNATDIPDLSKAPPILGMFAEATKFNGNIGNWEVSKITSFSQLFRGASSFNQDIGNWDVSAATDLSGMFWDAVAFDQDIGSWKVDSVLRFNAMFKDAVAFNQDLGNWNVSMAVSMHGLFEGASSFNQDIGNWDISSVKGSVGMFNKAAAFDQYLGKWDINSITHCSKMFDSSGMSTKNYDSTIIEWQKNTHPSNLSIGVAALKYCRSDSIRNELIKEGWSFYGDSLDCATTNIQSLNLEVSPEFLAFPNPTSGGITLQFKKKPIDGLISIYNTKGQLIEQLKINATGSNIQLDFNQYSNGLYLIRGSNQWEKVMVRR